MVHLFGCIYSEGSAHVTGVVMLIKKSFSRAGFVCVGLGLLKERGRGSLCLFSLG